MRRVALLAVLALAGCGAPQIPPAQTYGIVAGRVYDAATNAPIAGAVVRVDVVDVAMSGSDGTYTATNVPLGQTDVCIEPPTGYLTPACPVTPPFSLGAGQRYQLDVPLQHQ